MAITQLFNPDGYLVTIKRQGITHRKTFLNQECGNAKEQATDYYYRTVGYITLHDSLPKPVARTYRQTVRAGNKTYFYWTAVRKNSQTNKQQVVTFSIQEYGELKARKLAEALVEQWNKFNTSQLPVAV